MDHLYLEELHHGLFQQGKILQGLFKLGKFVTLILFC